MMTKSIGQKLGGAHGPARHYEWIAPGGPTAAEVAQMVESAVSGLKLYHRGDGEQHGCVTVEGLEDGTSKVIVTLYNEACSEPTCRGAHRMKNGTVVALKVAPALTEKQEAAMVKAVGEVEK